MTKISCKQCNRFLDDIDLLKDDNLCGACAIVHPDYDNLKGEVSSPMELVLVYCLYGTVSSDIIAAFTSENEYEKHIQKFEAECIEARGELSESVIELDEVTKQNLEDARPFLGAQSFDDLRYLVIEKLKAMQSKAIDELEHSTELLTDFGEIQTNTSKKAVGSIADRYIKKPFKLSYKVAFTFWNIEDVLYFNPLLSISQCCAVLDFCDSTHDASIGSNWETIEIAIQTLGFNKIVGGE